MAPTEKNYDSTVMRVAGNIASGLMPLALHGTGDDLRARHLKDIESEDLDYVAFLACELAQRIVQRVLAPPASAPEKTAE